MTLNRHSYRMTAITGFAVILFPFGAAAEDEAQVPSILVTGHLERATLAQPNATGSRLGLTPLETPASITTLEGDIVRARGDQSIADAVSRAPGIINAANLGNTPPSNAAPPSDPDPIQPPAEPPVAPDNPTPPEDGRFPVE